MSFERYDENFVNLVRTFSQTVKKRFRFPAQLRSAYLSINSGEVWRLLRVDDYFLKMKMEKKGF